MPPAAVHYDTIGTPSHDPGQLPSKGAQYKTTRKKEKRETDLAPNNAPNYEDNDLLESSDDEWTAMVAQWRKWDFRAEAKKTQKRNQCTTVGREAGGCARIAQDRDGLALH
jgi:hypothetical protein